DATLLPPAEVERAAAPEPLIARAAQMLLAAQRPVIYAGGGAVTGDAHEALAAVAEHLQAGIATTAEGKGVVSDANDLSLGERLRASAPRPSRKAEREALRAEMAALDTTEPNAPILKSLRAGTPEDAIVIAGMTQIGYYSRPFWPVFRPRTYLNSSYSGNLGF